MMYEAGSGTSCWYNLVWPSGLTMDANGLIDLLRSLDSCLILVSLTTDAY